MLVLGFGNGPKNECLESVLSPALLTRTVLVGGETTKAGHDKKKKKNGETGKEKKKTEHMSEKLHVRQL